MKYIFGSFFIIGVPLACLLLLQVAKKSTMPKRGAGLALLILGWIVTALTLITYIPMIMLSFTDARISMLDEVFGLFVWLVPGISFVFFGRRIRTMKHRGESSEMNAGPHNNRSDEQI